MPKDEMLWAIPIFRSRSRKEIYKEERERAVHEVGGSGSMVERFSRTQVKKGL